MTMITMSMVSITVGNKKTVVLTSLICLVPFLARHHESLDR